MSLTPKDKRTIQDFVVRRDLHGFAHWLCAQPQNIIPNYLYDPEFFEEITKNEAFSLDCMDWLLKKHESVFSADQLKQMLYVCLQKKLLALSRFILDFLKPKDPDALATLLAATNISVKAEFPPGPHQPPPTVLKLLHLYTQQAHLGRWLRGETTPKWNERPPKDWTLRDQDLAPGSAMMPRLQAHDRWLDLILESIFLLDPSLRPYFSKQHPNQKIIDYYHKIVKEKGTYYGDDASFDSDSEDNSLMNFNDKNQPKKVKKADPIRRKELFQKWEIGQKTDLYYKDGKKKPITRDFWEITRRTTPDGAGLQDKIKTSGAVTDTGVNSYIKDLKRDAQYRSVIAPPTEGKKPFVAQFRGLNYMSDRWSTQARRFHYRLNEVGLPQLSESVLKQLPFDIYTELDESRNFLGHVHRLASTAAGVHQAYQALRQTGHIVAPTFTANSGSHYLFNNRADFLQHRFSNGISQHLLDLNSLRQQHPEVGAAFSNAYNYGIATGNRPYHSEKYAFGLKDYYPFNFKLCYDMEGRLIHSHGGKIYIILYELEEFLKQETANRVLESLNEGRTPIGRDIILELETTFIGRIPGDKIVHQEVLKYPSFHKEYKPIYEVKYGLGPDTLAPDGKTNPGLYTKFQYLIRSTRPETPEREKVLELLKEWLCAYYEVLLVRIAEQRAIERDGTLVYIDHENEEQQKSDSSPLTKGGSHLHDRNRVHVLQNLRWELGSAFRNKSEISQDNVTKEINTILKTSTRLKSVYESRKDRKGVDLPDINELNQQGSESKFYENILNKINDKEMSQDEAKASIARKIIVEALTKGLFISKTTTQIKTQTAPPTSSASSSSSSSTSFVPVSHSITSPTYLYRDYEINHLLQRYLQPPGGQNQPLVFTAQHPLITGPAQDPNRVLFQDTLRTALMSDQTVVIPLNLTQEYVGAHDLPAMAGTHWVGLVARTDAGTRRLFYVDSLNNPIPPRLLDLLNEVRGEDIPLVNASTPQQGADVDCGAWTVDNLRRLALAAPNTLMAAQNAQATLRTSAPGIGQTLRQEHSQMLG